MDTVNTPVQKKPFPVAAIGFLLLALTFITHALSPLLTYVFNTRPTEYFSLLDRFDIPILLIQLFLIAFTLSLVCMLFIGKNNIVTFVCLLGMSICYVAIAVRTLFTYIEYIKVIELEPIPPQIYTSLLVSLVSNGTVALCAFFGLIMLAFAALFAYKGKKKLANLWVAALIPFALLLIINVIGIVTLFISLFSDWDAFMYWIDDVIKHHEFPLGHHLNNICNNLAVSTISCVENLLFVINTILLGIQLKKSVK